MPASTRFGRRARPFINGPFLKTFDEVVTGVMRSPRLTPTRCRAEIDPSDADQQTVLFRYPVVTAGASPYTRSAVKIEAGARSALDPHVLTNGSNADSVAAVACRGRSRVGDRANQGEEGPGPVPQGRGAAARIASGTP